MSPASAAEKIRVRVEEEGSCVRRLEVEVDAARVRDAFERAYRDLGRRVNVRGFRPGKAPRAVLERLYASSVTEQIEQELVAETLPKAVAEAGLEPACEPAVEAGPPEANAAFRYTARIEVKPTLSLPDTSGLPAFRPLVEVGEAEVERELEALRERSAPILEEPEGTALEVGLFATLDFVGRIGGEPFQGGSGQGVEVEIGSGRMLPGFEDQLVGARAGDDREVRVRFPEDHANPKLAGQEAVFAVHVVEVKRRRLPALDDEFAKDLGSAFESLADLRERIRADLLAAREQDAKRALRTSLMDALIERAPFEVPPGMVRRELEHQLAAARRRLEGAVPAASLEAQMAHWREEWLPRAEREVRERLLLEAVAAGEGLAVEEAEVAARLEQMASEQRVDVERLRRAYGAELGEALRAQLLEEKALEFLGARAKVEEKTGS